VFDGGLYFDKTCCVGFWKMASSIGF
jgi:hypothetical protein